MFNVCIYHANCLDGFTAAWVVQSSCPAVQLIPASYGDEPPYSELGGKDVIIVDFSYPLDRMQRVCEVANKVVVLDHHASAKRALESLDAPNCVVKFTMAKSGAGLAWDYFYPSGPAPSIVQYVQDRDLWRFKLPHTRAFIARLGMVERTLSAWNTVSNLPTVRMREFISQGDLLLRAEAEAIKALIDAGAWFCTMKGYRVPVINCPYHMVSETLNRLAEGQPFAVGWYARPDGKIALSFRSSETGADVSLIAESFGGGGHRHASGAVVEFREIAPILARSRNPDVHYAEVDPKDAWRD